MRWRSCGGARIAQIGAGDGLAHLAIGGKLRGAARAARDMIFDLARVAGIELAVDQRVKKNFGLVAGHFGCSSSAIHADRSMARARARRDITVPTGASTMSAISRYERLWISRNTKVSRNGSASALDQPPDRGRVALAQHLRLRRFLRLVPQRRLLGAVGHVVDGGGRRARRAAQIRRGRRCAGSRTARASSPARDSCRNASARADSIPAPRPRRRRRRAADSAPAYRHRRDTAAPRRESAAPSPGSSSEALTGIACCPAFAENARCPAGCDPPAGHRCDALVLAAIQP